MDHVGIVVEDLEAAIEFFVALGLELRGQASVGGDWVDRAIALEDVRADIAMLGTPDGQVRLELSQFHSPAAEGGEPEPSNRLGIRHLSFLVEDLDDVFARLRTHGAELVGEIETYRDFYRLCYLRGPAGIIVELAEEVD